MGSHARTAGRRAEVARLAEVVRAIEVRDRGSARPEAGGVVTGWASVDGLLGADEGLASSTLHEWFGLESGPGLPDVGGGRWSPPVSVLVHLAGRAVAGGPGFAFWVGRRVWPYPPSLARATPPPEAVVLGAGDGRLLARSVFVDPSDDATRLWAIDLLLRCPSARVVVADARRLTMAASRRLQLAAESGGALALLARPASERSTLSVASTRWLVRRAAAESPAPRWSVELLRHKSGGRHLARSSFSDPGPASPSPSAGTTLEWDHASCAVVEPPHAADRPDAAVPSPLSPLRPVG